MAWKLSNFAQSTLRQSVTAAATTMYIDADEVDLLPTLGVSDKAKAVIYDGTNREIVNITAWTTDGTLTVERARESTTAQAWSAGVRIIHTPTAEVLQAVLNATSTVKFYGTCTNVSNAYTVNVGAGNPLPTLAESEEVTFVINATNTGAVTLSVTDGTTTIGPKSLVHQDDVTLESGDFRQSWLAVCRYNVATDAFYLISATSHNLHGAQMNDGPLAGVNKHPNGRMAYWRGGTSFASPSSLTETADGWFPEYDGSIGTFTIARQSFTLGQTDVPGNPKYFLRWDHSSAGSGSTLRRLRIPLRNGVEWRQGQQVTRSVWLKADSARSVTAKILQYFGTGGSPSATVEASSTSWNLTTSWQQFTITATMPSISGKTLGSNGDDSVVLTLDLPVNVTMTIDVADDDIRPGHIAGMKDDIWPVPWWLGGTGGSYQSSSDFISDNALMSTSTHPDLAAIEALAGTDGLLAKTAANTWALRNLAVGTGLSVSNPAGIAGNPTVSLGTALTNYNADPMSVAELASVTAAFGTAAFLNTGTSGATIPRNDSANTFSAAQGVAVTAAGVAFTLTSTDAGASSGPDILLYRNSASPATSDALASIFWRGKSSSGVDRDYVSFSTTILDATNTSEDGQASINTMVGGTLTEQARFGSNQVLVPVGSAASPGLAFLTGANYGFYFASSSIRASVAGTLTFQIYANVTDVIVGQLFVPNGSAASPSITNRNDPDTGVYFDGSNGMLWATGGSLRMDLTSARLLMASGVDIQLNAATVPGSVTSVGFRGVPVNSGEKSGNFTGVAVDAGGAVPFTAAANYTIPANASVAHPIGTTIFLPSLNGGGNLSVVPDAGVTLRRGDGTAGTGTRTVPVDAAATIWKRGTNEWYIYGTFS